MAGLSLKHVYKTYPNGVLAVKDFSLEIDDKEFFVFAGETGCGVSTVLRMIAGLEEISSGELFIGGAPSNDVEPKDRDLAMVFKNCVLYPQMTVRENMEFGLRLQKNSKEETERLILETAKILGLTDLLERKPETLSDVEKQQAAIGRAVVRRPKALLMDEPLSNLNEAQRGEMQSEISRLHRELGTTILYVTHDQAEALALGTRIVVMNDGVIQQVGTPQDLYDRPCNRFVAGFFGAPQINLIPALAEKNGDEVRLSFDGQELFLSALKAKKLEDGGLIGKEVILGIRPEDISVSKPVSKAPKGGTADTEVGGAEYLSGKIYLRFEIGDAACIAEAGESGAAEAGEPIRLTFDSEKIHVFDKDTGRAVVN